MSNYKLEINSQFLYLKDYLKDIKQIFSSSQQSIHKARNEIKVISQQDVNLAIKSFKIPNFLNKILYKFCKKSKAEKSYRYALKIGNFTPTPIGYVEFYSHGFLQESFFVSQKFEYDFTIREVLANPNFANKDVILKEFANFTHRLHQAEILHLDYSPGNILIKQVENGYKFKIVDINRMKFQSLNLTQRLANFAKLWASDDDLKIIINHYSLINGSNLEYCIKKALEFSHFHKAKINLKKRLKGIPVVD